ncbi:MAG: hypothetical protein ACO1TE_29270 [Prosthecobacter sp.]
MPKKTTATALVIKAKPAAALAVAEPDKPALMPEFAAARGYIAKIQNLGRQAQHLSVLLGLELLKQKEALGIKAGRPSAKLPHGAVIKSWEQIVVEQTGLSKDTCDRWMAIAKGARKSLPILTAPDVLEKPFSELPEARQTEVEKILHKAVDGQTMHEMMNAFGVWKEKAAKNPPKATKASAAKRKANQADETLQQEQLIELAEEQLTSIEQIGLAEAYLSLDTDRLSAFETVVDALKAKIAAELKERRRKAK